MTKRELFVKERFQENIQDAINSIKDNKGYYRQSIDSWDHDIKMSFEIVGDVILAEIKGEYETSNPWTARYYNLKGWEKIDTSLEDALIKLVAYAQRQTCYKLADFDD